MPTLSQLPKRRQARFLLQLVENIESFKKRSRDAFRYATAAPPPDSGPRIFFANGKMSIEFTFGQTGQMFQTTVSWPVDDQLWESRGGEDDSHALRSKPLLNSPMIKCNCFEERGEFYRTVICDHGYAALEFLSKRLERASIDDALTWLDSCIRQPTDIGRMIIEQLEKDSAFTEEKNANQSEHRIVWRIGIDTNISELPFEVSPVLQRRKAKSGWTVGKKLRDPLESLPDSETGSPDDRILCALYSNMWSEYGFIGSPASVMQFLEILSRQPNVVWDESGYPPAIIRKGSVVVTLNEAGDDSDTSDDSEELSYVPNITIDGMGIDPEAIIAVGKDQWGGWLIEPQDHTLTYFVLNKEQSRLFAVLDLVSSYGARLDRESAERFSKFVSKRSKIDKMSVVVPESLAGPDVVLLPKVELQLEPRESLQLEARLRVTCHELDEAPTPGLGNDRILVHTPAGIYHLVRDLGAEAAAADAIADQLQMGEFHFDGPYTWLLGGLDESLRIIERVRSLGDAAPTVCWPKSKPLRLIGDITPQSLRVRLSSDRDWFGIDGSLELDGLHVPLAELMVAIRGGGRFVPLGDNQFATISDELRARMATIDDLSTVDAKGLKLARAAAPLIDEAIGLDIPAERSAKWQDAIDRLKKIEQQPAQPPATLKAELRDYQVAGYQWLSKLSQWGLGGCLADDMGLGKTVQTLGVLLDRAHLGPALIVAPTSVGVNWERETNRFAPSLQPQLYREHDRDHLIQSAGPGQLIITSYQMLQRDIERVASRSWATLVLDEAQYIKNFQTKTNQAVRRLEVDWCVALSGTPLENHLGELWSLLRVLCPGLLGSWERFRQRFGEPIEREKNRERLKALGHVVRPFILRRTKHEVLKELPPRTEVVLTAELSPAERKRYDAARLAALSELSSKDGDENEQQKRIRVLAWLTRLRQLSCHPKLVDPRWGKSSAKLDLLMETVDELRENGHRALVFSQFVNHLTLVREALDDRGIRYQYLDGSTPPGKRQEAVDNFQSGQGDLFLISLKAGGTGLNLTAADYVLHLDPWWNPAVEDQATDRAHRIGQQRPVTVYRLVAKDTIEEQILAMHEDKRELLSGVLDGADRAAKMSTHELVELIRDAQLSNSLSG